MESFKDFIHRAFDEIAMGHSPGVGSNYRYRDTGLGVGGYGYSQYHTRYDALMGVRRRQLLDPTDPMQRQQYLLSLINNLVADVDSGKVLAFDQSAHKIPLIYTAVEVTKLQYPPEEQKILINDFKVLKNGTGISASFIKKHIQSGKVGYDVLDAILKGTLQPADEQNLFGGPIQKNVTGLYFDSNALEQVVAYMDRTAERDDMIRRGLQTADTSFLKPVASLLAQRSGIDPSINPTLI